MIQGISLWRLAWKKGRGYVSAEKNKKEEHVIGVIPVDSLFSPVKKVNYMVEDTRVGQQTDYDKLTLEVWTDGTIAPDEAISSSAKILNDHLEAVYRTDRINFR
jgi:DNA-directed RNA polymerase subunit alpha